MTKANVIVQISCMVRCDQEKVSVILPELLLAIINAVAKGEPVAVDGFGTFYAKLRNQTTGRDIARNTLVTVPPHYIPFLRPYRNFTEQVKSALSPDHVKLPATQS